MAGFMHQDSVPWFKQPLVWMVIFFPLSAVVAGIYTFYLAYESDDGLVLDDYYWQGKQINRVLKRDQFAASIGLRGRLQITDDRISLQLSAMDAQVWPEQLQLKLMSATRKGLDQVLLLPHLGDGLFQSPMSHTVPLPPGKWYTEIGTDAWRLTGTFVAPMSVAIELPPE